MTKWSSLVVFASLVVTAALAPSAASGQVLYNNPPDLNTGWGPMSPFSFANDFSLASTQTVSSFTWWAAISFTVPGTPPTLASSFDWAVTAGASGQPGAVIASGVASNLTGFNTSSCCGGGQGGFEFTQAVGGLTLPGSATYWVTIANFEAGNGGDAYWETATPMGNPEEFNSGTGWQKIAAGLGVPNEGALCVSGPAGGCSPTDVSATPEPGSLVLLATGLAAVVGIARKRRKLS